MVRQPGVRGAARDGKDQPLAYYFGEGVYRPVEKRREYYARDHLGSIRDVLDEKGQSLARYDYSPYGKLTGNPQSAPEFGYAGMQYHAPSGLYLTLFRVYDPETGRWLSRDPIGEAGGINLYGYAGGNPVSFIDPLGLDTAVVFGGPVHDNPFGHIAIGFTGRGIYSSGTGVDHAYGTSFTDYLAFQATYRDSAVVIIKTTPEQEAMMIEKLLEYEPNPMPGLPGAITDNCATRSMRAMLAGGLVSTLLQAIIPSYVPLSPFPRDAFEHALRFADDTIYIPRDGVILDNFSPFNPATVP
jgi:RHS repeat-associated protein